MQKAYEYGPLALAFLGDAVYELRVRERLVRTGKSKVNELHLLAVAKVRASFQSAAAFAVRPMLTQEEYDVYRRGRNCSGVHAPKNADVAEYRRATGLEALMGYLYITDQHQRIDELMEVILKEM